ncbi:MAG: cobyrinate a,c-diamide synthase [Solirubrobacterales bacterium]|nr:cobyrinate a,c-diamide synthase [Solirubrobacterales bacterium]
MIPRIVIAGTSSGSGKTTVATGLLAALTARGVTATGAKVGPDFIDPTYHAMACGRPGRNLDAFLSGPELVAPLFRHGTQGAELAVVEGVMGLFDGASGRGELASTAHVAKLLGAPVVLVVDAAAMARSVAAIVHGYRSFDPDCNVAGVILNRVGSPWHATLLREAIEPLGLPVLGALPRDERLATPERHLGLVPADEREANARAAIAALGEAIATHCDLPAIMALARTAPATPGERWSPPPAEAVPARIAVARGPAFSFHYTENLELLEAAGAELLPFDPLRDERLPADAGGLLLAGGFPEIFGAELSANAGLREDVAALARAGRPVLAECGGLLYLAEELDGRPMCGVVPARARMGERLSLGYREAESATDHAVWPRGTTVRGHEFHYSICPVDPAQEAPAWTLRARGTERPEGHVRGGVHASYLHTHWAATPEVARRFVAAAAARVEAVA